MALTIEQLKELVNTNLADNSNIVPSEHRAVELALIDYLETLQPISNSNQPVNKGYITATSTAGGSTEVGIDILTPKFLKGVGNVSNVTGVSSNDFTIITVTLQNAHPNTKYVVKTCLENMPNGTVLLQNSSNLLVPVFEILSTTQFKVILRETAGRLQALRLHFETYGY